MQQIPVCHYTTDYSVCHYTTVPSVPLCNSHQCVPLYNRSQCVTLYNSHLRVRKTFFGNLDSDSAGWVSPCVAFATFERSVTYVLEVSNDHNICFFLLLSATAPTSRHQPVSSSVSYHVTASCLSGPTGRPCHSPGPARGSCSHGNGTSCRFPTALVTCVRISGTPVLANQAKLRSTVRRTFICCQFLRLWS